MHDYTIKIHAQWAVRATVHQQVSDGATEIGMKILNKEKIILWSYKAEGQCNWNSRSIRGPIRPANGLRKISIVYLLYFLLSQRKNVNRKLCQSLKKDIHKKKVKMHEFELQFAKMC